MVTNVHADKKECNGMSWGSKDHDDNNPSSKEAKKLIESGAGVCEVAKKCDHMEINVSIKDKKALHETDMYQNAPAKVQKELDESATHGHGHDNPNLKCYEVEYAATDQD